MKRSLLFLSGAVLALSSAWVAAQDAPESLLPPGFDKPAPRPTRSPAPQPSAAPRSNSDAPRVISSPVVQALPGRSGTASSSPSAALPANLPSLAELERMSPDELDELLGLKPKDDIPPAARRSLKEVGVIGAGEGGFAPASLAGQNPSLVRAVLAGNNGQMVSRWGHILLRRALASRLDAPAGLAPADFAGLRAALLVRMGEGDAARAIVQDVDAAAYSPLLTQAALDAYAQTADITGICPVIAVQGSVRKDADWRVMRSICSAFQGEGSAAMVQLDRLQGARVWPKIDMLLAQKYAGAAGKSRRAVTIEWDGVEELTPWRYALTIATGLEPPERLLRDAPPRYAYAAATAPMLGLPARAAGADRAAAAGVLSGEAMVDLYSQIYGQDDITGDWASRAEQLRTAYVGGDPAARVAAIKQLWGAGTDPVVRYSRQVLTAFAAARLPVSEDNTDDMGELIGSMLSAGLDRNAWRWAGVAPEGSQAWALLVLSSPEAITAVSGSALDDYNDGDQSENARRSAFLLAGLAGLRRVDDAAAGSFAQQLSVDLTRQTRWTRTIDAAAQVNNQALVALLAGVGMQGDGWNRMTPLHLYHIVSALNRVGLGAEARMIAAEAVARG